MIATIERADSLLEEEGAEVRRSVLQHPVCIFTISVDVLIKISQTCMLFYFANHVGDHDGSHCM